MLITPPTSTLQKKLIMLLKVVYTHYSQSVFFFLFRSMAKVFKDKVTQYVLAVKDEESFLSVCV